MIVAGMVLSTPLIFRRGFTWSVSDARLIEIRQISEARVAIRQ